MKPLRLLALTLFFLLAACQPAPPPAVATALPLPTETLVDTPPAAPPLNSTARPQTGPIERIEVPHPARLQWSAAGDQLYITTFNGLVIYNALAFQTLHSHDLEEPVILLDVSAASSLAAMRQENGWIDIVSLPDFDPVQSIQVAPDYPASGSIAPSGEWLVTSAPDEIAALVWDIATGEQVRTLTGFETAAPVYTVYFAPGGDQLVWWARGTVQLQDFETGELGQPVQHEDFVSAITLSPDGQTLVTAAAGTVDGEFQPLVLLWDAARGDLLGEPKSAVLLPGQPVNALAFSPDGQTLAAGAGTEIILWDAASQQELTRLKGHSEGITALAYSPDGRYLASASSDGTVLLWQTDQPQY